MRRSRLVSFTLVAFIVTGFAAVLWTRLPRAGTTIDPRLLAALEGVPERADYLALLGGAAQTDVDEFLRLLKISRNSHLSSADIAAAVEASSDRVRSGGQAGFSAFRHYAAQLAISKLAAAIVKQAQAERDGELASLSPLARAMLSDLRQVDRVPTDILTALPGIDITSPSGWAALSEYRRHLWLDALARRNGLALRAAPDGKSVEVIRLDRPLRLGANAVDIWTVVLSVPVATAETIAGAVASLPGVPSAAYSITP